MPGKLRKPRTEIEKKKISLGNTLAVEDRRNLVRGYQKQHLPVREIAEKCKVKLATIEADIRWLDKEAAGLFKTDELGRKSRELAELDQMEAMCIKLIENSIKQLEKCFKDTTPSLYKDKEIAAYNDVIKDWFGQRLKVKQDRAKWLGFEKSNEPEKSAELQIDNRRFIINIHGRDRDIMEYLDGNVRELQEPVEVIDGGS